MDSGKLTVKNVVLLLGCLGTVGGSVFGLNLLTNFNNGNGNTTVTTVNNGGSTTNSSSSITTQSSSTATIQSSGTATIQSLKDGASVARKVEVLGSADNLRAEESLWVYVYATGEQRYYPVKASFLSSRKNWRTSLIVGSVNATDIGASFEIGVFVASNSLTKELESAAETGMSSLPDGTKAQASINVTRK
jgi:hypothetical protein